MIADDLTRRAIIAAHDAACTCQSTDEHNDYAEYRGLTVAERAIVEAWRSDREQLAQEVMLHQSGQSYDVGYGHGMNAAAEYQLRAKAAEAAIERVRAVLHRSDNRNGSARPRQDRIPAVDILAALDGTEADHG